MRKILSIIYLSLRSGKTLESRFSVLKNLMKIAVCKWFVKGRKEVSVRIRNHRLFSYGYDNLDNLYREVFLNNEYFFESNTNKPIIVDCGANIGTSTLYFKTLFPKSTILAFEANPVTFQMLEKNVRANDLKDVFIYNIALASTDGFLPFYMD